LKVEIDVHMEAALKRMFPPPSCKKHLGVLFRHSIIPCYSTDTMRTF